MPRPSLHSLVQALGLTLTSSCVGAFDWRLGGIVLGLAITAIGVIHDGGDT